MSSTILPASRYACVLIDEAFKLTVCNPEHERLLRRIIELLIPGKKLQSITFGDKEQHGLVISDKNAIFDLYCTEEGSGEQFIVEMQVAPQESYRERMLAYATYPIHKQLSTKLLRMRSGEPIGRMDYSLRPVYVVSVVNFSLPHEDEQTLEDGLISRYELRNARSGELMTEALHFVYLELGRLRWGADEAGRCENLLEQFAHAVKYMHLQRERPSPFADELLTMLYDAAELANMNIDERTAIDKLMTTQLDINGYINYAENKGREEGMLLGRKEGRKEGREEGLALGREKALREMAQALLKKGMSPAEVADLTGVCTAENGE